MRGWPDLPPEVRAPIITGALRDVSLELRYGPLGAQWVIGFTARCVMISYDPDDPDHTPHICSKYFPLLGASHQTRTETLEQLVKLTHLVVPSQAMYAIYNWSTADSLVCPLITDNITKIEIIHHDILGDKIHEDSHPLMAVRQTKVFEFLQSFPELAHVDFRDSANKFSLPASSLDRYPRLRYHNRIFRSAKKPLGGWVTEAQRIFMPKIHCYEKLLEWCRHEVLMVNFYLDFVVEPGEQEVEAYEHFEPVASGSYAVSYRAEVEYPHVQMERVYDLPGLPEFKENCTWEEYCALERKTPKKIKQS